MEDDLQIAPADTLPGQLQRGRGAGFLRALQEEPETVHPLLFECITGDYRWDGQVESRDDYYARLCIATEMSLDPLREYLRITPDGREGDTALVVSTLGRMAALGNGPALAILREYVTYGPLWDHALGMLAELPDREAVEGLADAICTRFETGKQMDDDAFYDVLSSYRDLVTLWEEWGETHPCITRLLKQVEDIRSRHTQRFTPPDYKAFSIEELLSVADINNRRYIEKILLSRLRHSDVKRYVAAFSTDNPIAWWIAFNCLATMKRVTPFHDFILERVVTYLESFPEKDFHGLRHGLHGIEIILQQLPTEMTLPLARRWYSSPEWHLRSTGEGILKKYATLDDMPQVQVALAEALSRATPHNTDIYKVCGTLEIMARFSDVGIISDVEAAYIESRYSYARQVAVRALSVNAPAWFAQTYAYECLWDCEGAIRRLGCEGVSLALPAARERLQALADDPFESDMVKQAAATRLSTP